MSIFAIRNLRIQNSNSKTMDSRRDFLKKMTAASMVLPLLPSNHINKNLNAETKQLRVAMVGLGSYANRVADAVKNSEKVKIVGGVTGTSSKIADWQTKYGVPKENCYSYADFDKIKDNPNIDAVYICLPNSMHAEFTFRAAKAGKHVICEKPMSVTVKEAEAMIAACQTAKVKLYIGYRLHFEPFTRELMRLRTSGELGKIMFVTAQMGFKIGDPKQWRLKKALAGGGAMMDVGIYCINAARYATGEEPIWVNAEEQKTDPIKFKEVDETITWQMGFPSGVVAHCATTYSFNGLGRLTVSGEKDTVELFPAYNYGPIKGQTNKGDMKQPVVVHQTLQMDGMADCILNGAPEPNIDGFEGLKDMKIIEAIYKSIAKGGEKIKIK
jgi:predicted dehydrogenase